MWSNKTHPEITALLVDGANAYKSSKKVGYEIDYAKMLKVFRPSQAMYFTALPEKDPENPNGLFKMIDYINYNGYTLISKPTKTFVNFGVEEVKGNMDVEITVHILKAARWANHIVLFTGDGDFRMAVEEVQNSGVQVTVVSALRTNPPMVADELRRQANVFIDLCDREFRNKIEWDRSNRQRDFLEGK